MRDVVDKLLRKHQVTIDEVEQVILRKPRIRFVESGDIDEEDLYAAVGRTESGRYLKLAKKIAVRAQQQGVSSETLINVWLKEKVMETEH